MKRLCLLLLTPACAIVGCKKEQPKVEVNVAGANLKVNEQVTGQDEKPQFSLDVGVSLPSSKATFEAGRHGEDLVFLTISKIGEPLETLTHEVLQRRELEKSLKSLVETHASLPSPTRPFCEVSRERSRHSTRLRRPSNGELRGIGCM